MPWSETRMLVFIVYTGIWRTRLLYVHVKHHILNTIKTGIRLITGVLYWDTALVNAVRAVRLQISCRSSRRHFWLSGQEVFSGGRSLSLSLHQSSLSETAALQTSNHQLCHWVCFLPIRSTVSSSCGWVALTCLQTGPPPYISPLLVSFLFFVSALVLSPSGAFCPFPFLYLSDVKVHFLVSFTFLTSLLLLFPFLP